MPTNIASSNIELQGKSHFICLEWLFYLKKKQQTNEISLNGSFDGDLLLFSDGSEVHDTNQNIMPNGIFSGPKLEPLSFPIPGRDSLYYLLRSDQQRTDYSIIDMILNNVMRDIIPNEK